MSALASVGNAFGLSPAQIPFSLLASGIDVVNRLRPGIPFAAPCFGILEGQIQTKNDTLCQIVKNTYVDEYPRISTFGSYTNTQWETCQSTGEQCLLDWTNPNSTTALLSPFKCQYGSVSPLYIDVETPEHVMAAFSISKLTGIPLAIRNTGHDYLGRSSAPKSLGVSMSNLKKMESHDNFVPEGCPATAGKKAITLGAGVTWEEAYTFADKHNATMVGGGDGSVGASGGFMMGGGQSPIAATMGLGADRAFQMKVVTPDGKYRTANACQNSDLFWALRGGGGGTFGVVMEMTHWVEPKVPLQVVVVGWASAPNMTLTKQLWKLNVDNAATWAAKGMSGFVFPQQMVYITPVLNAAETAKVMKPVLDWGNQIKAQGVAGAISAQETHDGWLSFFNVYVKPYHANTGKPQPIANRLVPKANFVNQPSRDQLFDALMKAYDKTAGGIWLLATAPTAYNKTPVSDTSVNPAWRETVYEVVLWSTYNYNATKAEKKAAYDNTSGAIDYIRKLTPDASYYNEADVYEPNWKASFWGGNYDKLLAIKNKYDPDHLLDCWRCIGFQEKSPRYSCYL